MDFKLGNTKICFTFGFFAILAIYILLDRSGIGLAAVMAVVLHESGHILAMYLTGTQITQMRFSPVGVQLERRGLIARDCEIWIYLSGVLSNALTGGATWVVFGRNLFSVASLGLIIFNLLPIGRLDGGQLLHILLERKLLPDKVNRLQKWIGFLILLPIFGAGFYLLSTGNGTLLLTGCYLAAALKRE